jgi:hypothetical protein
VLRGDLDAQFAYWTGRMTIHGDPALGPLLDSLLHNL